MTSKSLRTTFAQKLEGPDQFLQAGVKTQSKNDPLQEAQSDAYLRDFMQDGPRSAKKCLCVARGKLQCCHHLLRIIHIRYDAEKTTKVTWATAADTQRPPIMAQKGPKPSILLRFATSPEELREPLKGPPPATQTPQKPANAVRISFYLIFKKIFNFENAFLAKTVEKHTPRQGQSDAYLRDFMRF